MEQLKPAIEFLKQYGFWIAIALILLGAVGVWHMVTSELIAQNESRASKIRSDVSTVTRVRGEIPSHPNPLSHEKMEDVIEGRQAEVLEAWQTVYDAQRDILVWPEQELTQELIDEYRDLIPIEQHVSFPILEEEKKETALLNQYRYYISNVLPDIAKIAKAKWTAKFDSTAQAGGMEGMDTGMELGNFSPMANTKVSITGARSGPLVKWPESAQTALISELFPWKGRRPDTLEVYYSQENLWILRQLLAIIAEVNGKAQQPFEAKIRQIDQLSMGRKVRFTAGALASPGVASMGGNGMGMEMGMDMEMGMGMDMGMGMEMGMEMEGGMGMGMEVEKVDPADNRYVDTELQPITGSQLRAALDSESPSDAPLKVAKRVPVMMALQIDQRAVPELLAACGSAPLMVQVMQTRILPLSGAPAGFGGGGMDSGMEMGMGMEGGMEGGMETEMGMSSPVPGGDDQFPLDVKVEVYGLIHIYNPPQKDKLGVDQITAETVIDGETMAEKIQNEKAGTDVAAPDASLPAPGTGVVPEAGTGPSPAVAPAPQPAAEGSQPNAPAAVPADPNANGGAEPPASTPPAAPPAPGSTPTAPAAAGAFWLRPITPDDSFNGRRRIETVSTSSDHWIFDCVRNV